MRTHKFYTIIILLCLSIMSMTAKGVPAKPAEANLHRPMSIPLVLSGNFGELRSNHFHSGLDFKTQGRTGFKVMAAADGYVTRVLVSPWGFGRAVYITHPLLGLTTVYGHLDGFNDVIAVEVAKRQEADKSFRVDIEFPAGVLPVRRGEVIAYSGNAGSSGGPHLHLDVRNAANGHALDPLAYFRQYVTDNVAPEMRGLYLVPAQGVVDGGNSIAQRTAATLKQPFKAWGKVVPAIKAYDRMTGTSNIYGVKYLTLKVDGREVYRRVIDEIDFDNQRAVNTLVDYPSWVNKGEWVMVTSVPESHPLGMMVRGDGSINVDSEREYKCEFVMEDEHGNRTSVPFSIVGQKAEIPAAQHSGNRIKWQKGGELTTSGAKVTIPGGALYEDAYLNVTTAPADGFFSPIYVVGAATVPLHKSIDMELDITNDSHPQKSQYVVVRVDGTKKSAVGGKYSGGKMKVSTSRFGRYAVTTDTQAPTISPLRQKSWGTSGKISLKIADALSGIEKFDGYVDGQWVLMELDGKSGTLTYKIDRKKFPATTKHTLKVTVTDACGNSATQSYPF